MPCRSHSDRKHWASGTNDRSTPLSEWCFSVIEGTIILNNDISSLMEKKLILCIDDDPFYCDFYKTIFDAKGYKVETTQDLSVAIEKSKKMRPALITLDVMMPESGKYFDGYGLLRDLKSDKETSSIPIIMISALDQGGDTKRAKAAGADMYIPKQDLTPDGLLKSVEKLISK